MSSKPISSGNNGGYLNLVNELIPLGKVIARPQDDESTFNFTAKVKKKSPITKFYYKIWVDLYPEVDDNHQYNFVDDPSGIHEKELLAEGDSEDENFTVTCTVPNPSVLGISEGEERFYRVRFAVSNADNITQNGFYDHGEVEDYLLSMSVPSSSSRQNTADGFPKGDQNDLINSTKVAAEATTAEDADTASNELVTVAVLPNPASESVNVSFDSHTDGAVTIALYTLSGSQIFSEEIQSSVGSNTHKLNTTIMTQGTYIIKVKGAGVDSSTLLAIERE